MQYIISSEKRSPNDDKKSPEKTPTVPNLCIECSTPRTGSSWGYMHAGTIHSPICTSCMTKNQNGDPCPICTVDIEAILQVMT